MITRRFPGRRDGKSSASASLKYGAGLTPDRETGEYLDKAHRIRLGNFGLIDDGVYAGSDHAGMFDMIDLAAIEMQSNCDLNCKVTEDNKLGHFLASFGQEKPTEAVLRDTEDSMLKAMDLSNNHFATFLHNDNGQWHLHLFISRIAKEKPHRCNQLWRDKLKRDKVCREIEIRHGLIKDIGAHEVDSDGKIIEIPLSERRKRREEKEKTSPKISDRSATKENYSGEKSFQTWCVEIRIGDRLKHAKSWKELHQAAAAYSCEVKQKGDGYIICPIGESGGIALSKVGLKNLPKKFGAFVKINIDQSATKQPAYYEPGPLSPNVDSKTLYNQWKDDKRTYAPQKTEALNALREIHKEIRADLKLKHREELIKIRAKESGNNRIATVSIAKFEQATELAALAAMFAEQRTAKRRELAAAGPGNTFRDYLVKQAEAGNDTALELAKKYGTEKTTDVLKEREREQLNVVATVAGNQNLSPPPRLKFTHQVERNGTVIYSAAGGKKIIDSALAKQIQLNHAASIDQDVVAQALRFAMSKYGQTLTLTGSSDFQKRAVETSIACGLNCKFVDPKLDAYRQELFEERAARFAQKTPKTPTFENKQRETQRSKTRKSQNAKTLTNFDKFDRFAPHPETATRRERMRVMRGEHVATEEIGTPMLLPRDAHAHLDDDETQLDPGLRHGSHGRREQPVISPSEPSSSAARLHLPVQPAEQVVPATDIEHESVTANPNHEPIRPTLPTGCILADKSGKTEYEGAIIELKAGWVVQKTKAGQLFAHVLKDFNSDAQKQLINAAGKETIATVRYYKNQAQCYRLRDPSKGHGLSK